MTTVSKLFRSAHGYVSPYFVVDVQGNLVTNTITVTGTKIELTTGSYLGYNGDELLTPTTLGPSVTHIAGTLDGLNVNGTVDISGNLNLTLNTFSLSPTTTGTLNNTSVGVTTAAAGRFTTLTTTDAVTLSPTANVAISPTGLVTISPSSTLTLGTVGQTTTFLGQLSAISTNQTVTLSPLGTGTVTINPATTGAINNVAIGVTAAAAGTFTSLSATSVSGTGFSSYLASPPAIGSATESTGKFTTLISTDVTASSSATTGAVIVAGGIGVNGVSYFGAAVYLAGNPTDNLQAATKGYVDSAAGGSWSTITTATLAVAGAKYFANTATASFTITLPATPATNTTIYIADLAGTFDRNNLTIARNSSLIMGLAEDLILNIKNVSIALVYSGVTYGWKLV
jgi:hypothetical protein